MQPKDTSNPPSQSRSQSELTTRSIMTVAEDITYA